MCVLNLKILSTWDKVIFIFYVEKTVERILLLFVWEDYTEVQN